MANTGPIILIDDDHDECDILGEVLKALNISNKLLCFTNGKDVLDYLSSDNEQPFLILSDINMPVMGGIELRKRIHEDDALRKKSVPFIFLTTTASPQDIETAYEMSVQGFFQKEKSMEDISAQIKEIYDYWHKCTHPNK